MNQTHTHHVRRFLRDCAEGRKVTGDVPPALYKRAGKALRRMPPTALVSDEDVVSELVMSIREGRWSKVDWETLTDAAFEQRLSRSLHHIVVESIDGWTHRKALLEHVSEAMAAGLPKAGGDMPHSLCEGDRFSRRLIAEAAAWVLAKKPELAGDATLVTQAILEISALRFVSPLPANDDCEAWEPVDTTDAFAQIEAALDAEGFVRELSELLTEREAFVLRGRLAGRGLQELADELGCVVSTTFNAEKKATGKVAELVRRRGVGADTLSLALDLCLDLCVDLVVT